MIDRLSGRDSFRRFDGARRYRTGPLTVLVAEPPGEHPVLAFAVPRRVGGAVVRNRVRRRLREAARQLDAEGELPTRAYLVVVHPPAAGSSYQQLLAALRTVAGRVAP